MWEYLEDRPALMALVLAAIVVGGIVEYVVKRRNGTWVPYRRRPVQGRRGGRLAAAAVMALIVLPLGGWTIYSGIDADRPGSAIGGAGLIAFTGFVTWTAAQAGRDVTPEEHEATTWRRPWIAWWVAAQGAVVGLAGIVMLAAAALGDAPTWVYAFALAAIVLSPLLVLMGLRLRVAVPAKT